MTQDDLSFWDKFLISITPRSHAEAVVDAIYSSPSTSMQPDPIYDPLDFSSPNVYVEAKGAAKDAVSALGGFSKQILLVGALLLVLTVILHAGVTAFVRR